MARAPFVVAALLGLGSVVAAQSPAPPSVVWFRFTPAVLAVGEPEDVRLEVQTRDADGAVLALPAGVRGHGREFVPLEPLGGGRFGVTLEYGHVLHDYQPDRDVMHTFVGNLQLLQGGVLADSRYNMHLNVSDGTFGPAAVRQRDPDMQSTAHVVNIVGQFDDPSRVDLSAIARRFYQRFGDDYDFLSFLFYPEHFANRTHSGVRNAVQGIGLTAFDRGASWGSRQRLLGYTVFPILSYFDMGELAASHELGHQWLQFLDVPALHGVKPHWPASTLAYGVMGYQTQLQGLELPFTIDHIGGDEYRWQGMPPASRFTDMDLYLMGLLPPAEVKPHFVPREDRRPCAGCDTGPVDVVTVEDVIRRHGHRLPDHTTSQKHFRVATIVVSDRPLSTREMSFLDHFAARGEAKTPLPFSSGLVSGTSLPWFLATDSRSTLSTTLE